MARILVIDNYDSFVFNLVQYLAQLGSECTVVRNDEVEASEAAKYDGVLISPGPGTPDKAGVSVAMIKFCAENSIPLFGVCLGHQALGEFFGAQLNPAEHIMHGKTSQLINTQLPMYEGMPLPFNVMRYHSLILSNLPECLLLTAETAAQEIMSFAHKDLPIWGLQFHPESILSENGLLIIRNWLQQNGLK